MNYEYMNGTIRDLGKKKNMLFSVIDEFNDREIISDDLQMRLEIAWDKLNGCYTHIPEITERDILMDHYWDKIEQIDDAVSYGESLENKIRHSILEAEVSSILHEIQDCIYSNPETAEALNDWICGELDAERDYEMYGCD